MSEKIILQWISKQILILTQTIPKPSPVGKAEELVFEFF